MNCPQGEKLRLDKSAILESDYMIDDQNTPGKNVFNISPCGVLHCGDTFTGLTGS